MCDRCVSPELELNMFVDCFFCIKENKALARDRSVKPVGSGTIIIGLLA